MFKSLVLASNSPRRAELLRIAGWPFTVNAPFIDETRLEGEAAVPYVRRLSETKASTIAEGSPGQLVLGADTVVVMEAEIMGKPKDIHDAGRMLNLLSGNWHEVLTGVALVRFGEEPCRFIDHESTLVRFASLSTEEIERYLATGEPMDKAGAYAIQGQAAPLIAEIRGDYFNIVGLPLRLVYQLLKRVPNAAMTRSV